MAVARSRRQQPLYVKSFVIADWDENTLTVIPTGIPTGKQLGPHQLAPTAFFETTVYQQKNSGAFLKEVGVSIKQYVDGSVIITKAPLAPVFDGVLLIRANKYNG
jgi:hypothetical protein